MRRQRAVKDDTNAVYLSLRVSVSFLAGGCQMLSVMTLSRFSDWAKWSRASLSCEPEPLRFSTDRSRALTFGFCLAATGKNLPIAAATRHAHAHLAIARVATRLPFSSSFYTRRARFILQYLALWGGSPVAPLARRGAPFSSTQRRGVVCS